MELLPDILLDALIDCAKLIPFLLATLFLMEYMEHRAADRFLGAIRRAGRFGPALGAAVGCLPQCGFSAATAQLFNGGLVSAGTLVAVFLSTSDEAVPILLGYPEQLGRVVLLIVTKVLIALVAGFSVDLLWTRERQRLQYEKTASPHECVVEKGASIGKIFLEACKRTLSILLFLFLFSVLIGLVIGIIGEERLSNGLLPGPLQPLLSALFGFIPNCAASVLLTKLYLDGMITFGSAVSGLCTAAGVGLLVLFRKKHSKRTYAVVIGSTYAAAALAGLLLQAVL